MQFLILSNKVLLGYEETDMQMLPRRVDKVSVRSMSRKMSHFLSCSLFEIALHFCRFTRI